MAETGRNIFISSKDSFFLSFLVQIYIYIYIYIYAYVYVLPYFAKRY